MYELFVLLLYECKLRWGVLYDEEAFRYYKSAFRFR